MLRWHFPYTATISQVSLMVTFFYSLMNSIEFAKINRK